MSTSSRWKHRPPGSNWGDFGSDDPCGRMNHLTPEKVMQGIQEVRTGQTFNLSLPLDFPGGNVLNPRRQPPVLRPTLRGDKPNMNYQLWCDEPACTDVVCDDLVIMHLQYSTQWDSLAHVGSMFDANGDGVPEPVYYNGFRAGTDVVGPSSGSEAGIFGFPEIARESTLEMNKQPDPYALENACAVLEGLDSFGPLAAREWSQSFLADSPSLAVAEGHWLTCNTYRYRVMSSGH